MKLKTFILITFIYLFNISFISDSENTWELVKDEDNIKVYTRFSELSSIKEVKIATTFKASLSQIVYVFQNVNGYTNWVYLCSKATILERKNSMEVVYYMQTDSPWPVSDRDAIILGKTIQDPNTKEVSITSECYMGNYKEYDDFVRLKKVQGIWKFKPINKEYVEATYYLNIDPGGNIPDWVTNYSLHYGPYYSAKALKELLQNVNLNEISLSYIKEFE